MPSTSIDHTDKQWKFELVVFQQSSENAQTLRYRRMRSPCENQSVTKALSKPQKMLDKRPLIDVQTQIVYYRMFQTLVGESELQRIEKQYTRNKARKSRRRLSISITDLLNPM